MYDIIIIGAGASGLMAAIQSSRQGKKVLLIEKMSQAGRKLRISGKGRCNLTNTLPLKDFLKHCGSEPRFLYPAFTKFFSKELMSFFEGLGVELVEERGGRIYPRSGKAQDIFLAMINELEDSDCQIIKNTRVTKLLVKNQEIVGVRTESGKEYLSNKVILAAGGESYPATGSEGDGIILAEEAGHNIIPTLPALVGLVVDYSFPNAIVDFGVKNAKATITNQNDKKICEEFGELNFAEDGVYGPIILTISRIIARTLASGEKLNLILDFKPAIDEKQLDENIIRELNFRGKEDLKSVLRAFIPQNMITFALTKANLNGFKQASLVSAQERKQLLNFLKNCKFQIVGDFGFEEAIITQGGVDLKEINPKTLESKLIKGLFFAGEVMDLDADTGGFNLQIAFSTGYLAAH